MRLSSSALLLLLAFVTSWVTGSAGNACASADPSVPRMKGVVEIDTGQDCKYVGLQKCHQQFKRRQGNGQCQGHHSADPADRTERGAEHGDEAREYLQGDMAGQHVGEKAHAMRKRSRQEGDDFNC